MIKRRTACVALDKKGSANHTRLHINSRTTYTVSWPFSGWRPSIVSTKELVGTHGIYTFHLGQPFGTDERSRVMVKLEKGGWKLLP